MHFFKQTLDNNWLLQSSENIQLSGVDLSSSENEKSDWHRTQVPSTVLATLLANNVYSDLYVGMNLETVDKDQFKVPWWYYTEFEITEEQLSKVVRLQFDGINYKANVWINGQQVADTGAINGAYRRTLFNIADTVQVGKNRLAIELIPPKPGDYSIGFVDWNVTPPDRNMGIFREVSLLFTDAISIDDPIVNSNLDVKTLQFATLNLSTGLTNHSSQSVTGILQCSFDNVVVSKEITILPNTSIQEEFTANEFEELKIANPKLWWPNGWGEPNLYKMELSFEINNTISDKKSIRFGIRLVEDYINEDGHKGFKINGKEILIKGAGWTDDLLLQDTHESLANQVAYVKHMGLNCIRLEGIWGKDQKLYDLCDENGILMMVGWSCHWEHEDYLGKPVDERYGGAVNEEDINLLAEYWEDQLIWLRQHPSIFVWNVGSDKVPHPELEKKYLTIFDKVDKTRPYLNSTGGVGSEQGIVTSTEVVSEISGSSGMKMLGPYAYTPPMYWYSNQHLGGAYGFNTETCPGANVPTLASLKKMLPEANQWPIDDVWEYHCGSNAFATLDRVNMAIEHRYGKPASLEDYAFKSQLLNYELMRPMFEAFVAHQHKSTGIIQWMLNSAWPSMYWQLYDSYLQPTGAFYGAKKALRPTHAIYRYGMSDIFLSNCGLEKSEMLTVKIRILDLKAKEIYTDIWEGSMDCCTAARIKAIPEIAFSTSVLFLDLRVYNANGVEIDNNLYWIAQKKDVLDYQAGKELHWEYYTPTKQYADFKALSRLNEVELEYDYAFEDGEIRLTVNNLSEHIAFFIHFEVLDVESHQPVLPVFWDDNYISLLPGEGRTYYARIKSGVKPLVKVNGWNIQESILK